VLLPGRLYAPPPPQGKLPPLDDGRPDYYERLAAVLATGGKLHKVLVAAIAGLSPAAAREVAWRATGDAEAPAAAANVLALAAALQALWRPAAGHGGNVGDDGVGWEPGMLRHGAQVTAFAPYVIHGGGEFVRTPTLSAAAAAYFAGASEDAAARPPSGAGARGATPPGDDGPAPGAQADAYAQQRANVAALLRKARQGITRRLAALAADEPPEGEAQRLRTAAEWLLALSSQITRGQTVLEVPLGPAEAARPQGGETPGDELQGKTPAEEPAEKRSQATSSLRAEARAEEPAKTGAEAEEPAEAEPGKAREEAEPGKAPEEEVLRIALDPQMTPVEQAQRLFKRAAKAARAEVFIPQRRAELQQDLALVEELALDLQRATNQPEIAAVQRELQAAGLWVAKATAGGRRGEQQSRPPHKTPGTPTSKGGLLRVRSRQGLEIVVGRSARQNERVTFDEAHPEDLWLHARGTPGAHVVIRGAGQTPDEETVRMAAQLAAYHSGARGDGAVAVIVTRKRFVQRAPGGKVGQVLVKQEERVVTVRGEMPEEG
jgi:predicted ribosome quality control (RQC) complex YloA/Tae2 family protein